MSNPTVHDSIVLRAVAALQRHGYTDIQDDCSSSPNSCPDILYWKGNPEGHRPDIVAWKDGKVFIFEIEEGHTLGTEHTASQIRLFAATAAHRGGHFFLTVPAAAVSAAGTVMKQLGLQPSVWSIP